MSCVCSTQKHHSRTKIFSGEDARPQHPSQVQNRKRTSPDELYDYPKLTMKLYLNSLNQPPL